MVVAKIAKKMMINNIHVTIFSNCKSNKFKSRNPILTV